VKWKASGCRGDLRQANADRFIDNLPTAGVSTFSAVAVTCSRVELEVTTTRQTEGVGFYRSRDGELVPAVLPAGRYRIYLDVTNGDLVCSAVIKVV
jgi:hypothetical protein